MPGRYSDVVRGAGRMSVPAERPRDDIWDALVEVFGFPGDRKLRNRTVKDLREAGATVGDIYARVQAWPMHFDFTLTERGLVKYWGQLAGRPLRAPRHEADHYRERMMLSKWAAEVDR